MAIVSSWCDIADAKASKIRICDAQTVSLSRVTSETLAHSCQFPLRGRCTLFGLPALSGRKERATVGQYGLNSSGLHVAYNDQDNGLRLRKEKRISQTCPKFGLGAETRPHEAGIPSNRLSSSSGEYVPAPCTHRPSSHPSLFLVRLRFLALSNQR